jgi:peptide/nickel transport system substrate-binding protein
MKRSTSVSGAFASRLATAAAVLACLVTAAHGGSAAPMDRPRYGGTLRMETPAAIPTLDPAAAVPDVASSAARDAVLPLVFDTLTRVDLTGLQPLLADSWTGEAQDTRWRFHLRPGVRLHDGTSLTAARVATALQTFDNGWTVKEAGDDVVIESEHPMPDLPWELANLRRAIVVSGPGALPLGTGPFRVDRWEPGRRLVLAANEACRDGRPFVDAVQIEMGRPIRDEVVDLEVGRVDLVPLLPQDVRRVSQRGLRVAASAMRELVVLVFDPRRPGASQEALRTSVAVAIDRSAICAVLLQHQAEVAGSLLPDWLSGYAAVFAARYDPAAARSIVASLPFGRRALSLEYAASDPIAQAVADRVAVDLREAGLALTIVPASGNAPPPPDARLLRIPLEASIPERALASLVGPLGLASAGSPVPGSPVEEVARFEQALLERNLVVPLVHLRQIYGFGARVRRSDGPLVTPSGRLSLADVWLREDKP